MRIGLGNTHSSRLLADRARCTGRSSTKALIRIASPHLLHRSGTLYRDSLGTVAVFPW